MKVLSLIQSVCLLAATSMALAPPRTHPKLVGHAAQIGEQLSNKKRAAAIRNEHFAKLNKNSLSSASRDDVDPNASEFDSNWAGATISPPSGETFKSVTATMTLPSLTKPPQSAGPGGEYFLYVWVGIDGDGDCDALWQTGFAGQIEDGVTSWWGWVCFISSENVVFDTYILDASTGDTVNMTVEALSSSEGIFWLENLSTGESQSYQVAGGDLCMESAEWIVEDPYASDSEGDIVYFLVWPDFGTMTFDDAVAYTNKGTAIGPEDATLWYIDNYYNNITQNSATVTDSTASVTWVASGPGPYA
ncbi:peptidase A4 family-domain-containing protein [Xylogone sp. PMI_703]|nr:peptidase A4 family-domain-containing protein [Xylogone sp. PMI_703]